MRILIYGGRNFGVLTDERGAYVGMDAQQALLLVSIVLKLTDNLYIDTTIISGGATGADALGEMVASALAIPTEIHNAQWDKYGRSAGPRRNKEMLNSGIDVAIKCPGGKGTAHMTSLLERTQVPYYEAGVDVYEV